MNAILNFFERKGVPDNEAITDSNSDIVQQEDGNADALATILGDCSEP